MPGTLFVVATPIGNLEDLTFRALRTLKEVDLIAAEDTRRTANLLAHYDLQTRMVSLHEHNETREAPRLVARLTAGESIALVTDAGTPGVSDPGAMFVRCARNAHIPIVPIPGPSAVMAAISASGFEASQFVFLGFPPRSGTARAEWLNDLVQEPRVIVFFEAPHRIAATVSELRETLGTRPIIIGRELTKRHEEFIDLVGYHNTAGDLKLRATGEFAVVVAPDDVGGQSELDIPKIVDMFGRITNQAGVDEPMVIRMVAAAHGVHERQVRKAIKKSRIKAKQQNRSEP